jgi:23S rRNA (cytosine1962-C5)-methyltransferase
MSHGAYDAGHVDAGGLRAWDAGPPNGPTPAFDDRRTDRLTVDTTRLPAGLPVPGARNLAVRVTKDAGRQIRGGHPWVFDGSITSVKGEGTAGDLAVIFDGDRKFMAVGLYDPISPLRIRVLHRGRPLTIDREFWRLRLSQALDRRGDLVRSERTTAWRWVHGENDGMPGLVLDRYDATIVLKLYTAAWIPHLAEVIEVLHRDFAVRSVVLRLSRAVQSGDTHGLLDGMTVLGEDPAGPIAFRENGLAFTADVVRGQKTGHFLDQRDNRQRVLKLAAGASVLDVFCCTGGFSVHAAAGGAASVHSVDRSRHALAATERHLALNRDIAEVGSCRHRCSLGDAFDVMADLVANGEGYDLVVVDPPSFAVRAGDVPRALAAYGRLTDLALDLVQPGGTLVQASCSARVPEGEFFDLVEERARLHGSRLRNPVRAGAPLDHPVGFPEGAYLKALLSTVE